MKQTDRAWKDYGERFRREVMPKLLGADIGMSVFSGADDVSVQGATELGMLLLLGKPVILVCPVGAAVPEKLRAAASFVIDEWDPEDPASQERIADALRWITGGAR